MIYGNASWGLRETPLEKQLEMTKNMGLSVLELGIANAPGDIQLGGNTQEVVELYKKYGIDLVCAATGNDFTNGNKDDVEKLKGVIDMCSDMGVKYLRIFAGFSPVEEVVGERWSIMIDALTEVAEYAKVKNVTPVVETHGGVNGYDDGVEHFCSTTTNYETLKNLYEQLPENIYFNYDPANLYAVGIKNPDEIYQLLKERVAYIHLKDFVTLPSDRIKPAACGESDMDWNKIMDGIGDREIIGVFEYEITDDVEAGLKRCYNYIKNLK